MHDTSAAHAAHQHAAPTSFIRKHVFSLDHKVIGKQYYALALLAVFIGMVLSWLMRLHLGWPAWPIPMLDKLSAVGAPQGVMTPEYYLSLMTMHGTLMVFFVLTNAPFAAFGNYFLPIQIGAEDMAFPRFNMMSFWTTFVAFLVMMGAFFVSDGPPISGWTAYAPLSAVGGDAGPGLAMGQNLWAISIAIFCIGSLLGALNFIATTLDLRTKGMSLARMPFCSWAWFVTSVIALLAFAVLLPACILLILDRVAGTSFFIPAGLVLSDKLQPHSGGSVLLWQHLFWFFGHPEVYIAILPSIGIVCHILPVFARKPLLGPRATVGCMIAIGFLSYMVWGHHMFVSGMNPFSATLFSVPTLIITIPATILTLLLIGSVYGAKMRFTSASLFCLGFISVFISGGISGFFLAQPSIDIYLHATYFVVAHFHFVMAVASLFGVFAGTYFWFPKMTGRMMNETLGKLHFWLTFIGVYAIFMPMHYLGLAGNVRRYSAFVDDYLIPLIPVHKFITVAALLTGAAQFIFLFNLIWSRFKGPIASENPWEATSLEWSTTSPPPFDNFGGKHMVVYNGPNEYGVENNGTDFVMQTSPEKISVG
ncbi:MAG TPA: cbb3-type cytochrome c oxidase subunit I [Candidatus Acidoferrales bacterium]|jgi:cytochrome c oxidase subunit 1|nr:cbb3-type cytochrome c oxidase subunit I [Candidatus Acidoferrales bacterium]